MQIETTVTSHLLEWVSVKKIKIAHVGKNVEKGEPLYTVDGNVNWYSHYGKEYVDSSKNKNWTTILSRNLTWGYISKWNEDRFSMRYLHAHVHWSIIQNNQDMETI